jgi:hypothetical protein
MKVHRYRSLVLRYAQIMITDQLPGKIAGIGQNENAEAERRQIEKELNLDRESILREAKRLLVGSRH